MFSGLGNIFTRRPRHAENADTRLDIRRHDPDQPRKSGEEDEAEPDGFTEEEDITVSIEALRAFLENFLKTAQPVPAQAAPVAAPEAGAPAPRVQQAVNAYQASARSGGESVPPPEQAPPPPTGADLLDSGDVRLVHELLADLQILSGQGVQTLILLPDVTFLQSLAAAVARARQV